MVTLTGKRSFVCRSSLGYICQVWCSGIQGIYARLTGGLDLAYVYVHCAIYETYLVYWFLRDICSIGGGRVGSICHGYICIVLYMKLIWMNVRMTQRFSVVVFHRSIVDWGGKLEGDFGSKLEGDC